MISLAMTPVTESRWFCDLAASESEFDYTLPSGSADSGSADSGSAAYLCCNSISCSPANGMGDQTGAEPGTELIASFTVY